MHKLKTSAIAAGIALTAVTLTACDDDPARCGVDQSSVMFYSSTDHHYHYGSPSGSLVPSTRVPKSATKVPGYKPYTPPVPKPKPAPAPKVKTPKQKTSGGFGSNKTTTRKR